MHAPTTRRRLCLLDRRFNGGAQVIGPQIEEHETGVELGEVEQILGEPVEPLDLLAARLEELGARLRVVARLFQEQLVERAQRGERGPQLVRDVGEEVTAPVPVATDDLDALLQARGHRVELRGQLLDLEAARERRRLDRHPAGEVALAKVSGGLRQAPQRRREPAGQPRGEDEGEAQHDDPDGERAARRRPAAWSP